MSDKKSKKKRKYSLEEVNSWRCAFRLEGFEKFPFPKEITPKDVAEIAVQFLKRVEPETSSKVYRKDQLGVIGKESMCSYEDACASATKLLRRARVAIERERVMDKRYAHIGKEEWVTAEMWKAFSERVKALNDRGTISLRKPEKAEIVREQNQKRDLCGFNPCFPFSRAALLKLANLSGGQTTERILEVLRYRIKERGEPGLTEQEVEKAAQKLNQNFIDTGIYESDFDWFIICWPEIGDLMCELRENAEKMWKST